MAFKEQMSAFLDELSGIIDEQKKVKEEGMDLQSDTPFSSQLTQDEEPSNYSPEYMGEAEPEVIMRGT